MTSNLDKKITLKPRNDFLDTLEFLPEVYYEIDMNLRITYTNKAGIEKFGYTIEDINKGLYVSDVNLDDIEEIKDNIAKILKGERDEPAEYQFRKKDGSKFWGRIHSKPIYKNDKIIGLKGLIIDITEKKKIEEALRKSGEKYRNIFENMSSGIAVYEVIENGKDFIFKDYNKAGEKLTGYKKVDLIGKRITEKFPDVSRFGLLNVLKEVWKTGIPQHHPTTLYKDERLESWYENFVYKLSTGEIINVFDDISERKKAEAALVKSEKWYRLLLNSITDGLWVLNKDWQYQLVNEPGSNLVNLKVDQIIGNKITDLFPGIELTSFYAAYKRAMDNKTVENVIDDFIFPDGRKGHYEVRIYPIPEGILCIGRDISEKMKTERELQESEEKYSALVEQAQEGVIIIQYGVLKFANKAVCEISGYSKEDIMDKPFLKLSILENVYTINPDDEYHIKEDFYPIYESKLECKDGTIKDLEIIVNIIQYHGYPAIMAILRDITWRKRMERELAEKSRLATIGQLAAGIAHQLNTPLANISLTNEYILDLIGGKLKRKSREEISKLLRENIEQVSFCAQIVKELLQFSRRIQVKSQNIVLFDFVNEIINLPAISLKIKENKIKIEKKLNKKNKIKGDKVLLSQCLQNIINNSVDALNKQDNPKIKIISEKAKEKLKLRIIDNGKGISQEDLPRIFEPFYTTKGIGKGTGLGLAICRGIIEKHGGTIEIKSNIGEGTEVIITFPTRGL
ncbi:MAG: PAS domain-containing sensor histidine kinase [Candidatus Helarchaeota archaeon]